MASGERWRIIRDMFRIHSRYVFDPCVFRPALSYYADCVLVKCARSTTNTLFLPAAKSIYFVFNCYKKKREEERKMRQIDNILKPRRDDSSSKARKTRIRPLRRTVKKTTTTCANCKSNRFIEILHVTLQVSGGGNFPTPPLPPPSPPHSAPVTSLDAGTLYVTSIAPARIRILMHCMHVHRTSRHKARQPTRGSNIVFQNPYLA